VTIPAPPPSFPVPLAESDRDSRVRFKERMSPPLEIHEFRLRDAFADSAARPRTVPKRLIGIRRSSFRSYPVTCRFDTG